MRLRRLELVQYGAFTGRAIEIGPGLTVVHGPNESGKSTFGVALADLLWGLTARDHPYAFRVAGQRLTLKAEVERSGSPGDVVLLVVDSRGFREVTGSTVEPWWRGGPVGSRQAWQTSLGLDRRRLREGGRQVLEDGGDLAELLFRARVGVDLAAGRNRLLEDAERRYRRHAGARNVTIRLAADAAKRAHAATQEAVSSASEVVRLRDDLAQVERDLAQASLALVVLQTQCDQAGESVRAWEPVAQLVRVRADLKVLREQGRVLDKDELVAYEEACAGITRGVRQCAELDRRIDDLDDRIAELEIDRAVLRLGERIDALTGRRAVERETADSRAALRDQLVDLREGLRKSVACVAPEHPVVVESAADAEAILAAAESFVLPVDITDWLDREARAVDEATAAVKRAQVELTEAERRREEGGAASSASSASTDLVAAREKRDRAWIEVLTPWLSGELPEHSIRLQRALAVEHATAHADVAADSVAQYAELVGRLRELDKELVRRIEHLTAQQLALHNAERQWSEALEAAGLPLVLDPPAWEVRRDLSGALRATVLRHVQVTARLRSADDAVAAFAANVRSLAEEVGLVDEDHWVLLDELAARLVCSRTNEKIVRALLVDRDAAQAQREACTAKMAGFQAVVARFTSDDDLSEVAKRSHDVIEARSRERELVERVRAAGRPGAEVEALIARIADRERPELEAEEVAAKDRADAALRQRDSLNAARALARTALDGAERAGSAAEFYGQEVAAIETLAAEVDEFVLTRLMATLLDRVLSAETPQEDSALLAHASQLARRLTRERVTGLTTEEQAGRRRLRVEAAGLAGGLEVELSDGTADQVFLALRLAGIRQLQGQALAAGHPTLPVLLDDVLMAHDDDRTAAALAMLIEEAKDQQILLTTHHRSVADEARRLGATVVMLDPLPDQDAGPVEPQAVRGTRVDGTAEPPAVRAWARSQGIQVEARGRLPGWVVEAYLSRDLPDVEG